MTSVLSKGGIVALTSASDSATFAETFQAVMLWILLGVAVALIIAGAIIAAAKRKAVAPYAKIAAPAFFLYAVIALASIKSVAFAEESAAEVPAALDVFQLVITWVSVAVCVALVAIGAIVYAVKRGAFARFLKVTAVGVVVYAVAVAITMLAWTLADNSDSYAGEGNMLASHVLVPIIIVCGIILASTILLAVLRAKNSRAFKPAAVVIANEARYDELRALLADQPDVKVYAGAQAIDGIVESGPIDMVLTAMVGFAGLSPTIHAIKRGKTICLANKETLVVAGELICNLARRHHAAILPVDSEHSAIFQCLAGEGDAQIEKILLTASGGPFRNYTIDQLATVTKADALHHPTWEMGAKITIDSATMINKGFEVIEAKWLFGVEPRQIQVLVHPQSIVHSAVQFCDGAVKAQLGVPDMRLPIQYAFSFPERIHLSSERLDLFSHKLEFFEPDMEKFRCLSLAFDAIGRGGNMPCILNAANEVANRGFLDDRCGFLQMGDVIAETMNRVSFDPNPSYETYVATDAEARRVAAEIMQGGMRP